MVFRIASVDENGRFPDDIENRLDNKHKTYTDAQLVPIKAGLPLKGHMPNGTDVNTLTTPGVYIIASLARAQTMQNLAVVYPGIFYVDGDPSASGIIFSQTQRPYGSSREKYERITVGAGPVWTAWDKTWPLPPTPTPTPTPTPATSAEAGLANKAWLDAFIAGRGGSIGTGGRAAVSIRVDHGAVNFRDKILPKARERNIPISFAINPGENRLNMPESAGVTWADYNSWALNDAIEPWNHSMGHLDATTTEDFVTQLVTSKALLQEKMPNCAIEGFAVPGVGGTNMLGWTSTNTPQHFYDYEAGRLVLANHAVCTGYIAGKLRPLMGVPINGQGHYSIDGITTAATIIGAVKDAQAMGAGLQIMVHPSQVDLEGKITTAVLDEVMDYIANERDAGRLMLLSMSGLLLADARHSYRHNLLANGNFDGLTGWAGPGTWATNGTFARSTSADAGMLTQTITMSDRKWAAGRVRELTAQFRSSSGGVARISVTNAATGLSVSKDVNVPAGTAVVTASEFFTIPATATSISVSVGRVSGDVMEVQQCGVLAA